MAGAGEHRLWGGMFAGSPAEALDELNRSLPFDQRLWAEDIEASRAWAGALRGVGVLGRDEVARLEEGLTRVAAALEAGAAADATDEDVHTLIERMLYGEVGELAGKLHTGRSRNDQVATSTRLWTLRTGRKLIAEVRELQAVLLARAEERLDTLIPAYTHLRRAQPVRAAHWLLSHFWPLVRDRARLEQALERVSVLPLGSGAVAGCAWPVDREMLRERLGFDTVSANSMDAVSDRDWVCDVLYATALCATHLSRLAEDLILFSSEEFGFIRLPEAYTTGSSLLPQKRNPDGLELARASAARLLGDLVAMLALLKALPSGYQKDLQEDKPALFHACDTLLRLLPVVRGTVAHLVFEDHRLAHATADPYLVAVDIADALARAGVPFRDAHRAVGLLLRSAEEAGIAAAELPEEVRARIHPALADPRRVAFSPETAVERRSATGGTARAAVADQIERARQVLG